MWAAGIDTIACCQEEFPNTAYIEFDSSSDVEVFLAIAQRGYYRPALEVWDRGGFNDIQVGVPSVGYPIPH